MLEQSEFAINIVDKEDILNDIKFTNEIDRLLMNDIINELEEEISIGLKEHKVVQLPFIGCLSIDEAKAELSKHNTEFKIARKNMTTDEYKKHVSDTYFIAKAAIHNKKIKDNYIKILKSKNKKKYEKLYRTIGKNYANTYIYALSLMKEIPFNLQVQETFDRLNNEY